MKDMAEEKRVACTFAQWTLRTLTKRAGAMHASAGLVSKVSMIPITGNDGEHSKAAHFNSVLLWDAALGCCASISRESDQVEAYVASSKCSRRRSLPGSYQDPAEFSPDAQCSGLVFQSFSRCARSSHRSTLGLVNCYGLSTGRIRLAINPSELGCPPLFTHECLFLCWYRPRSLNEHVMQSMAYPPLLPGVPQASLEATLGTSWVRVEIVPK